MRFQKHRQTDRSMLEMGRLNLGSLRCPLLVVRCSDHSFWMDHRPQPVHLTKRLPGGTSMAWLWEHCLILGRWMRRPEMLPILLLVGCLQALLFLLIKPLTVMSLLLSGVLYLAGP